MNTNNKENIILNTLIRKILLHDNIFKNQLRYSVNVCIKYIEKLNISQFYFKIFFIWFFFLPRSKPLKIKTAYYESTLL